MQLDRILRMILGRVLNRGINAGIRHVANRGQDPRDMTPEDRARAREGQQNAKRARQAMRITRRMGKF
ncbi:MAG: hypothetical protein HLUCCA08_05080 [Rhodobacteraceae bacterium HLUCCA08]|nr:MAG: hypothetical protein HLUCCA08_05080 [Rhodobacteraceae bacterium HLUCCA08]